MSRLALLPESFRLLLLLGSKRKQPTLSGQSSASRNHWTSKA